MDWTELIINTTTKGTDHVTAALTSIGTNGFMIEDAEDFEEFLKGNLGRWDYIDDELISKRRGAPTVITIYIPQNSQGREMIEIIKSELERLKKLDENNEWGDLTVGYKSVKDEDWADNWKNYYHPTKIGNSFVVCPSWEKYDKKDDEIIISLDPGMAFGTGTHETTQLCLQLWEKYKKSGENVLDLGCGSGILSVAAVLSGAQKAVGVDIDQVAVRVANENAAINSVTDKCEFICGNLAEKVEGKFQIIFANIVSDVIISFLPQIEKYLAPNGVFITSGIIDVRRDELENEINNHNLEILETKEIGGWVGFVCRLKQKMS